MNALAFAEVVKNPGLLRNYSLSELQDLAQRHPYASTVYSMIALKAHMDADDNYEHYLNQAAIRIPDRKRLYHLIHSDYDDAITEVIPQLPDKQVIVEDDMETVIPERSKVEITEKGEEAAPMIKEELVEEKSVAEPVMEAKTEEKPEFQNDVEFIVPNTQEIEEELEPSTQPPTPHTEEEPNTQHSTPSTQQELDLPGSDEVLQALGALKDLRQEVSSEIEEKIAMQTGSTALRGEKTASADKGAHSFSEWLSLVKKGEPPATGKEEPLNTQPSTPITQAEIFEMEQPETSTEEEDEIEEIITAKQAKASLSVDDELVTETLAQIYVLQKKYDKAIKAYQTLSLKYPDKRAYFAEKIEKLKNR